MNPSFSIIAYLRYKFYPKNENNTIVSREENNQEIYTKEWDFLHGCTCEKKYDTKAIGQKLIRIVFNSILGKMEFPMKSQKFWPTDPSIEEYEILAEDLIAFLYHEHEKENSRIGMHPVIKLAAKKLSISIANKASLIWNILVNIVLSSEEIDYIGIKKNLTIALML